MMLLILSNELDKYCEKHGQTRIFNCLGNWQYR